jgi:tellurite methyltransferase
MKASPLIPRFLPALTRACKNAPALDLACGKGRNGLYLVRNDVPVVFADRNSQSLLQIEALLRDEHFQGHQQLGETWQVDFEVPGDPPLAAESFGAIVVFRYLHRPLLKVIQEALVPGGLMIYETFTEQQASIGRPRNPDFLLRSGELAECFSKWIVFHDFEGIVHDQGNDQPRAIAQLVAEKPV